MLIGNPPWVAFRHMSADLQKRFKALATGERIYVSSIPSHNDLCALFVARSAHLYLRAGGRVAFVLPLAALTRAQFEKFRTGRYASSNVAWEEAWTTDVKVGANGAIFPVPSCVVFGRKRNIAAPMPATVREFSGSVPMRDAHEDLADRHLIVRDNVAAPQTAQRTGGSPYRTVFRQGAILIPRAFVLVERKALGRLGNNQLAPAVVSRRSSQEKQPWKSVAGLEGKIETEFLRPILLGESILPYRLFNPFEGVIPVLSDGTIVDASAASARDYDDLASWLKKAEAAWDENGKGNRSFAEQLNYINQLSAQFPIPQLRVVYAKAGTQPAACIIRDDEAVVDHMLYWAKPNSEDEAHYLCAIVNSETVRERAEAYQARGQFGARHFDKVVWNLPIPRFDAKLALHREIAALGAEAERLAEGVELVEGEKFQRARQRVRRALIEEGVAGSIEKAVERLLGPA